MTIICYSFPDDLALGGRLARLLDVPHGELELHRFPDGETRVRLGTDCAGKGVVIVCGGRDANGRALPMQFAAQAARDLGARRVGLVSPYLAYMRQDRSFTPGEAVSAVAYARFLSAAFDWVATVDPHLHRIPSLAEVFSVPAACVSSAPAIAAWIRENIDRPVIVGPDSESAQWVRRVAGSVEAPWTVLAKSRAGDRKVVITAPDPRAIQGCNPVLVDDIASSGHTLAQAATVLRQAGSAPVTCVIVHAVMSEGAEQVLQAAGVARLVSTNTIAHPTNGIDVSPLLAAGVRGFLARDYAPA